MNVVILVLNYNLKHLMLSNILLTPYYLDILNLSILKFCVRCITRSASTRHRIGDGLDDRPKSRHSYKDVKGYIDEGRGLGHEQISRVLSFVVVRMAIQLKYRNTP